MQTHNKQYQNNVMKCDMTWPSRLGLHGAPPMVLRVYGATFASDNIKLTVTMSYVK